MTDLDEELFRLFYIGTTWARVCRHYDRDFASSRYVYFRESRAKPSRTCIKCPMSVEGRRKTCDVHQPSPYKQRKSKRKDAKRILGRILRNS